MNKINTITSFGILASSILLCLFAGCGERAGRNPGDPGIAAGPLSPAPILPQDATADVNIEDPDGVPLVIRCLPLGYRYSVKVGPPDGYEVSIAAAFEGTAISFRFWGLEEPVEGRIAAAYRYYWDSPEDPWSAWNYWSSVDPMRDPDAKPQWRVRVPADGSRFVPGLGAHMFVVELRDTNMIVTHCEFKLEVLPGPAQNPEPMILLIDDNVDWWLGYHSPQSEAREDSFWIEALDQYNFEIFDTYDSPRYPYGNRVPVRLFNSATTVIWHVDLDAEDPMTALTYATSEMAHYLHSYVLLGGNLIITGCNPIYAHQFWPEPTMFDVWGRGDHEQFDFSPRCKDPQCQFMENNFNWEVFGIEEMSLPATERWWDKAIPCDQPAEWDTLVALPPDPLSPWDGYCPISPFEITALRSDITVHPIYAAATFDPATGEYDNVDCSRLIAVYVPGDGQRGHAAYLGFPLNYFDHDRVITLLQDLLDRFGEQPLGP